MAAIECLYHNELSSNTANITTSSLSSSYQHLLLKWSIRDTTSSYYGDAGIYFNGVANSSTYPLSLTKLNCQGSSLSADTGAASYALFGWQHCGNTATSNFFSAGQAYIFNYADTTNKRPILMENLVPTNSTSNTRMQMAAGLLGNTANAISTIPLFNQSGSQLMTGSSLTVYGINGAS
jgi:hypothetical protein